MKSINQFLLEKYLIDIDSDYEKDDINYVNVKFPIYNYSYGTVEHGSCWKKLKLPEAKYIIFKDKYRYNKIHFSDIGDFIYSVASAQDDFENFNPDKDILYASNDLKDIMEWYFTYTGLKDFPSKNNIDEWVSKNESKFESKCIDNLKVIAEVYLGIDNWFNNVKEYTKKEYNNIEEIISSYN